MTQPKDPISEPPAHAWSRYLQSVDPPEIPQLPRPKLREWGRAKDNDVYALNWGELRVIMVATAAIVTGSIALGLGLFDVLMFLIRDDAWPTATYSYLALGILGIGGAKLLMRMVPSVDDKLIYDAEAGERIRANLTSGETT